MRTGYLATGKKNRVEKAALPESCTATTRVASWHTRNDNIRCHLWNPYQNKQWQNANKWLGLGMNK